jgi:hypothetical protein
LPGHPTIAPYCARRLPVNLLRARVYRASNMQSCVCLTRSQIDEHQHRPAEDHGEEDRPKHGICYLGAEHDYDCGTGWTKFKKAY